ncbi:hypothetical protein KEM52_006197 [Ascosphaera acerosa]|nr:hypothetical protein KEM52_006197 [Ascosphaera acerosa]
MSADVDREYLGGHGSSHGDDDEVEAEYDRLRGLAREEAEKRGDCFQRSQEAYNAGDGAAAKELSNEGKEHGAQMAEYNRQASEYIFRANNSPDRVDSDEIDLHGQFVEEAEDLLTARIRADQQRGQDHLHVIVGKGIHSVNHVQKVRPAVERVCDQLGLQHRVEQNEGRIYVDLTGGQLVEQQYQSPEGPHASSGAHAGGEPPQQQQQSDSLEEAFCKACCVVM